MSVICKQCGRKLSEGAPFCDEACATLFEHSKAEPLRKLAGDVARHWPMGPGEEDRPYVDHRAMQAFLESLCDTVEGLEKKVTELARGYDSICEENAGTIEDTTRAIAGLRSLCKSHGRRLGALETDQVVEDIVDSATAPQLARELDEIQQHLTVLRALVNAQVMN